MSVTTIRLSTAIRDRLTKIAGEDYGGASLGAALERLIDEHEMHQVHAAYARLRNDTAQWAEYQQELRLTDSAVADGLGDARDEYPEYNQ